MKEKDSALRTEEQNKIQVIAISGTPGTGKTTIANKLSKEKKYLHIDLNKLIKEEELYERFDEERESYVVDETKLNERIKKLLHERSFEGKNFKNIKGIILDSHLSHLLDTSMVDLVLIVKCELSELRRRLKSRGYSEEKIEENLESEIFDVCLYEAKEKKHIIKIIENSDSLDKLNLASILSF